MKKKALVLAVYMACTTPNIGIAKNISNAFSALNLGEVKFHSNLGEPFKAIIPILFTSVKQAKQLKIRLAPKSVFARLGAEKSSDLQYLRFQIKSYKNKPLIVVSSTQPIHSPILNFILEVESPNGITYQDYTVLLDPPKSKTSVRKKISNASAVKAKRSTAKTSKKVHKHKSKYSVKTGDTLSLIAIQHKHAGVSLKQMMLGIFYKNPHAFLHNDLNKLKKGAFLKIPSAKKIRKILKNKLTHKKHLSLTTNTSKKNISQHKNALHHYKVKRGDTLSQITKKYLYKGVSFSKMMRDIFKANPDAFSKNDINILFAGALLRIPTYAEVAKKQHSSIATNTSSAASKPFNEAKEEKSSQPRKQAVFKSVLENKANDASNANDIKSQLTSKLKDKKTLAPSEAASEELTLALQKSHTKISNLQKRIRELRGNLSSISNNYKDLSNIISDDSFLQFAQENNDNKPISSLIKEYKNQSQAKTISNTTKLVQTRPNEIQQIETTDPEIAHILNKLGLADKITMPKNFSLDDYSYLILALLLGIVLIRYRDKIYSYNAIPSDQPKYYLPIQDSVAEKELEIFSEDLASSEDEVQKISNVNSDPENDIKHDSKNGFKNNTEIETIAKKEEKEENKHHTKNKDIRLDESLPPKIAFIQKQQPKDKPPEISEESLKECDTLIDELILELSNKTDVAQRSQELNSKLNHLVNIEKKTSPIESSIRDKTLPLNEIDDKQEIQALEKELQVSTARIENRWKDQEAQKIS